MHVAPRTDTERLLVTAWSEVLGTPVERIGRTSDFFALGGTSLAAVRLVVVLDGALSLRLLMATPVLADLADALDRSVGATSQGGRLLQRLSAVPSPVATLVCFPYAGGNALNFRQLAGELEQHGILVHAVELPGHDVAEVTEPMADVAAIAARVHAEVLEYIAGPIALWGHCAGAAHALAVARLLEEGDADLRTVFVGAALFDDVATLDRETAEVNAQSDREIAAALLQDSAYVEFDGLKPERVHAVGIAYRHHVRSTNDHSDRGPARPGRPPHHHRPARRARRGRPDDEDTPGAPR